MARTGRFTAAGSFTATLTLDTGKRKAINDLIQKHKPITKAYSWICKECGHQHPKTDDLRELGFYMTASGVCITKCQACGSYAVARRTGPHSGEFLVVKAHNKIKGKGN